MTGGPRKRLLLATGSAALAVALAACGSSGPAGAGGGEGGGDAIQVWALQDTVLNPIEQSSVERFSEGDGGDASLETFGNDPYKQRLRVALGSPNAPDVFFNWGGGNLKEYVDAGQVADLTATVEEEGLDEAFIPSVLEAAQLDGKYYGVPMRGVQPVALYYNKAVFEEAGVQPPETYEELLTLVDTFKAQGITPIALAGSQSWTELMWAEYLLDRIGGPEVFQAIRDGEPGAWEDPAVLEAMTRIRELVDRGAFGSDFASVGYDVGGASTLLAQGRAAMHLMGSWEYVNQLGQSPEFVERGDLGYVAFPAVEGGEGDPANVVGNPTNFYSVAESSDAKETAQQFVATALDDEQYVDDLIAAGDVPAVQGVREKLEQADNADYTTWVYDLVEGAPSFQLSWDQDLPAAQATEMLTELQKLFLGDQTPEGFVQAMSS
ncbi:extracellular solute-binding protein [Vallicoccus soli]|uniref:Extracellular solute-binding protein n=1 Tax=Vallicoccus soli TaxID=2339232 RepID=A0A3A3YYW5_9ACTN|nr:extracellular solute-binding protein [Vallicoccus soli]RJK96012.1 extracellular solute-binding protein [Vallicoccus soli]